MRTLETQRPRPEHQAIIHPPPGLAVRAGFHRIGGRRGVRQQDQRAWPEGLDRFQGGRQQGRIQAQQGHVQALISRQEVQPLRHRPAPSLCHLHIGNPAPEQGRRLLHDRQFTRTQDQQGTRLEQGRQAVAQHEKNSGPPWTGRPLK